MNENNNAVIIEALVNLVKKLQLELLIKDAEIERIKNSFNAKETLNG